MILESLSASNVGSEDQSIPITLKLLIEEHLKSGGFYDAQQAFLAKNRIIVEDLDQNFS